MSDRYPRKDWIIAMTVHRACADAPDPTRLRVGVIGAGRVGSVLGAALDRVGHRVVAAGGVSQDSRRRAAALLPGVPLLPADEVVAAAFHGRSGPDAGRRRPPSVAGSSQTASPRRSLPSGGSLVLLAVPDDVLGPLVAGLADTGAWRPGQIVAHTSGAHGLAVLEPAARAGVVPLALHPAMTFTGGTDDLARLSGCTFGVTAPEPFRPVAEALALEMDGSPAWVAEESRALYHAALAVGANHLVTLVNDAADLLRRAGIDDPAAVLAPLLGAALDNALRSGDAALTGPVSRGDAGTLTRHVATLAAQAPTSLPAYVAMARLTADRALAAGRLKPDQAAAMLDALATRSDGARQ